MLARISRHGRARAFTLIELTIVLAVIVTLALILTPSIANFINDSRVARARNDCGAIGRAIAQFYADTGFFPMWSAADNGGAGRPANRLDLLVSPGNPPLLAEAVPAGSAGSTAGWLAGRVGAIDDQLVANGPGYALKTPTSQLGWNGPYLSSPLVSDPWNNRYVVNVGLLQSVQGVRDASGQVKQAVWVLSAGPDGVIQTPFGQPATSASLAGDDLGFRVQ